MRSSAAADREIWWLDTSAFPDLFWARMRVFPDGKADVLDLDGKLRQFSSEEAARLDLLEDEYESVEGIEDEDLNAVGLTLNDLVPPSGKDDGSLLPQMQIRRSSERHPGTSRP
jgi:hypothetical protein